MMRNLKIDAQSREKKLDKIFLKLGIHPIYKENLPVLDLEGCTPTPEQYVAIGNIAELVGRKVLLIFEVYDHRNSMYETEIITTFKSVVIKYDRVYFITDLFFISQNNQVLIQSFFLGNPLDELNQGGRKRKNIY